MSEKGVPGLLLRAAEWMDTPKPKFGAALIGAGLVALGVGLDGILNGQGYSGSHGTLMLANGLLFIQLGGFELWTDRRD